MNHTMYDVVVLVPYRDREKQLEEFYSNFWKKNSLLFEKKKFKLVIIEQCSGKPFNRGKLLNVGFDLFADKTRHFITHDVDTFPTEEKCINEIYIDNSKFEINRIWSPHEASLGGICKFTSEAVKKINGFPNGIWGWGIEDRALYWRAKIKKISLSERNNRKYKFKQLPHKSNKVNYVGEKLNASNFWKKDIMTKYTTEVLDEKLNQDGISTIEYQILEWFSLQSDKTVEKIIVEM